MSFSETAAAIYLRIADKLGALRKDGTGVTAIEYGLIAALIAVVIIGSVQLAGSNLNNVFSRVATDLGNALQ